MRLNFCCFGAYENVDTMIELIDLIASVTLQMSKV